MISSRVLQALFAYLLLGSAAALLITNATVNKFLAKDYDYIVVGGGTSGLVVANRLSEAHNSELWTSPAQIPI